MAEFVFILIYLEIELDSVFIKYNLTHGMRNCTSCKKMYCKYSVPITHHDQCPIPFLQ